MILIIILIGIVFLYLNQNKTVETADTADTSTTKVIEATVGTQTIENTLSSSGQISTNLTEIGKVAVGQEVEINEKYK